MRQILNTTRNVFGWIWFVLVLAATLVLGVIGVVILIPLTAAKFWEVRRSRRYGYTVLAWRGGWITHLFSNEEDGIDGARGYLRDAYGIKYYGDHPPGWLPSDADYDPTKAWYYRQDPWLRYTADWSLFRRVYIWSAWRNSVNNLRFAVRWIGGPYYRREFGKRYIHIGWNDQGFPVLFAGNKNV